MRLRVKDARKKKEDHQRKNYFMTQRENILLQRNLRNCASLRSLIDQDVFSL